MLTQSDLEQIRKLMKVETEDLKKEFRKEMNQLKEDILLFKDEILGEILDVRDDIAVIVGYRDDIEDHEKRITKLEKSKTN